MGTLVRWALLQLLQAVEPSCKDPMLVIYYISPASAIAMIPMGLLDIIHLKEVPVTSWSIVQVAMLVTGTGLFSLALIFAEVSGSHSFGAFHVQLQSVCALSNGSAYCTGTVTPMCDLTKRIRK